MNQRILCYLLGFLFAVPCVTNAELKLGPFTFAEAVAKHLDVRTSLREGLGSLRFVNQVGGVAFDGIAVEARNDTFVSVCFDYSRSRSDGERLHVIFKDRNNVEHVVTASICDWELFPIALFANSTSYACATSQGQLADSVEQHRHTSRGDWILNYHPAFENTLLGLRLAQADFLAVVPEAGDLPKADGQYLLGKGEDRPNPEANRRTWDAFQRAARGIRQDYTAYVICDHESPVTFSAVNGQLVLTGEPVWRYVYCTKGVTDTVEATLRKEVYARRQELFTNGKENRTATRTDQQESARAYRQLLREYTDTYLENRRAQLIDSLSEPKRLHVLQPYSTQMTDLIRRHRDMNAEVYDALTTTMRYAAFFRWVNRISPASLRTLADASVQSDAAGKAKTPSILVVSE